jgi:L-fuculose-phosphate aldolase
MKQDRVKPADPACAVAEAMRRVYDRRLTTTSGGNISFRDDDGTMWITPGGVDKGELTGGEIVRLQTDGSTAGAHAPSSEWPFHLGIYHARPDVRAIVHAHPAALTAFAVCRAVPDTAVLPPAHVICGPIRLLPYERSGSNALAERVAGAFSDGFDCVMMSNHGVIAGGADMTRAYQRFETAEHVSQAIARAGLIGAARPLTGEQLQRFAASTGESLTGAAPADADAIEDLRRFFRRGCAQHLLTSANGTISKRLDDSSFIINVPHLDRTDPGVADFAILELAHPPPNALVRLHAAVYRRHSSVNAVITAAPVNAAAYCITGERLDTHTMAEGFILLREVVNVPMDEALDDPDAAAALVSPQRPAALITNAGALVLGTSLLEAFDRLEVLEATAATLIAARGVGDVHPLEEDEIAALSDVSFTPRDGDMTG